MEVERFKKQINQSIVNYKEIKEEMKMRYLEILNKEINSLLDMINNASSEEEKKMLLNNYDKLVILRDKLSNI